MATRKKVAAPTEEQQEWFDAFWSIIWRRACKKDALRAFCKACKTPEQFALIIKAVEDQSPTLLERDVEKRPHPATWLNGERWEDEVVQPKAVKKAVGDYYPAFVDPARGR